MIRVNKAMNFPQHTFVIMLKQGFPHIDLTWAAAQEYHPSILGDTL